MFYMGATQEELQIFGVRDASLFTDASSSVFVENGYTLTQKSSWPIHEYQMGAALTALGVSGDEDDYSSFVFHQDAMYTVNGLQYKV